MCLRLQILISTYGCRINNLNLRIIRNVSYIIVHQKYEEGCLEQIAYFQGRDDIIYIKTDSVGLTCSRNIALEHFNADVGLISDDDVEFMDDIYHKIVNEYNGKTGVKLFKIIISNDTREFRLYPKGNKKYSKIDLLRVCSIEITFSKDVIDKGLRFDERFGIGGEFICGEESVFLKQAYDLNIPIEYINIPIAYHQEYSTATGVVTDKILEAKGAVYNVIFGRVLSLIFIFRLSFLSRFAENNHLNKKKLLKGLMNGRRKVLRSNTVL